MIVEIAASLKRDLAKIQGVTAVEVYPVEASIMVILEGHSSAASKVDRLCLEYQQRYQGLVVTVEMVLR